MNSSGTFSWKMSLIEFTKIIRGRAHFSGTFRRFGHSFSSNPCSYGWPAIPRQRSANVSA